MSQSKKITFVLLSLLLYSLALGLPCYDYFHLEGEGEGFYCLIIGWCSFVFVEGDGNPFPLLAWISNIPFFIGLFAFIFSKNERGYRITYRFLQIAFFLSLGSLIHFGKSGLGHPDFSPKYGCFIWILSFAILFFAAYRAKQKIVK